MDWLAFNTAISFADPLAAIGAAGLALVAVAVVTRGAGIALKFIRG